MATKIQLRRDTLANWTSANPILLQGEVGVITDTEPYRFRIGDGTKTFTQLQDSESPLTATEIRDLLTGLSGDARLDASAIKNLPGGSGGSETGETIKTKLEALTGDNRLDSSAVKNLNNFETFTELTDTPNSYLNNGGKIVSVNNAANALEFKNLGINDIQNFNVNSPSDGQVLMYTGTHWQAETIPHSSIAAWPTLAVTDDLVIDSTNISSYNCHIMQANGNPTAITVDLPQISTLGVENVSFIFVNAMQAGNILSISGQGGDTFNGAYFMRLYPGDSVKLDKPVSGSKWLITAISVNEDPMYVEATAPYNFTLAEKNLYLNFTDVASGNNIAQVLPNTTTVGNNRKVNIYLSDNNIAHKVTVSPDTGETIEGLSEFVINSGERIEFISDASEGKWLISSASDRGITAENGTDIERGVIKLNFPKADFGRNGDTLTIEPKLIATLNGTDTPFNEITNQGPVTLQADANNKITIGLNEDIVTFNMSDGTYPKLSHIGAGTGVKLTQDNNNAIISVANSQYNGFLAVFNHKQVIAEAGLQEVYRTTSLIPNGVIWQDEDIEYNASSGLITLKYTGTNSEKQLFKIAARATVRRQQREADLGIYLYLADPATGDYIKDINEETPVVNNTVKKELTNGDDTELVTMIAITQDTSFKVILKDDTPNKFIEVLDIAMGTSAIMIEKVNANNQPSNALASYERLTQQSMRFIKHEYNQSFENAKSLIDSTTNTNFDVPADINIQRDGWLIYFQDIGLYKRNTTPDGTADCFEMSDGLAGNGYFSIARVLEYEDTWALRGHEIKAKVDRVEQTGEFVIIPIVWKRRINEYDTKIITNMNSQGVYTVAEGWNVIDADKTVIAAPTPAETTASFTCSYTVPDDAINVGFILMPTKQQTNSLIKFTDFALGCDPTFERWVIEYPAQATEGQLKYDNKYVKFVQYNTTPYNMSQWYQIPNGTAGDNNFAPIYTGEAQLGGNADITRIYNAASSDVEELHNKGKWRFEKDGRVQVHYKIPVATDKFADGSDHNTFRIGFVKDTGAGDILQGTPVQASLRDINIPKAGNVFNDSVRTNGYANVTFTMDVKENDEYWIALNPISVPRTAGNEGHMYSYPSGLVEFTFMEDEFAINKLQSDLAEMQRLLRATTDAISNKAYIELGWDTGNSKPVLEAKTETP